MTSNSYTYKFKSTTGITYKLKLGDSFKTPVDLLFKKALKGDISILKDPLIYKTSPMTFQTKFHTPLHALAGSGKIEVLADLYVDKLHGYLGRTPLHELANLGKLEVLNHPSIASALDNYYRTPLHYLAHRRIPEILSHPLVGKVKDKDGNTALHILALASRLEILSHPDIDKVKNNNGLTPLHKLVYIGLWESEKKETIYKQKIRKWLKEKYPWFKVGNKRLTYELISEILNTPNALKFIRSI